MTKFKSGNYLVGEDLHENEIECPYCNKFFPNFLHWKHLKVEHQKKIKDVINEFPHHVTMTLKEYNKRQKAGKTGRQNFDKTKTKQVKCFYYDDSDCLKIVYEVPIYSPNFIICDNCKSKPNPDNRSNGTSSKTRKNTMMKEYGVDNARRLDGVDDKIRKTSERRYGGVGFASKTLKQKTAKTLQMKYGVDNIMHNDKYKKIISEIAKDNSDLRFEKTKKTIQERYGNEYTSTLQVPEIREKGNKAYKEKTGYDHPMHNPDVINKLKRIYIERFYSTLVDDNRLLGRYEPMFSKEDYYGVKSDGTRNHLYLWKCLVCGCEFEDDINNGRYPRCPTCYPTVGTSKLEKEILEFIQEHVPNEEIISNDRTILDGKEIDILIPNHNLGIEFNGLYWHGEVIGKKDKNYHLQKTEMANEKNIKLIHIFEDEWINKRSIVESMLLARLDKIENKIAARKCVVSEVSKDEARKFLGDNHIQGSIDGFHVGLYFKKELVSIMTFGKSRFNKKYEWEILRFCTKINYIVQGGMSKLFTFFIKEYNPKSIISYVDKRFGEGKSYSSLGMEKANDTQPSYFYVIGGNRNSRLKFQKHKLEKLLEVYDPDLSEYENMINNGIDRVYDCGCGVYTWTTQKYDIKQI